MMWCVFHGYVAQKAEDCKDCERAFEQRTDRVKIQNAMFSDRCGFCGGPRPCTREF